MDIELAKSVFKRWASGQPVGEQIFYKAAAALDLNPDDALLEARFYTALDYDLKKIASGKMIDDFSIGLYSAAAGADPRELVKTAAAYALHPLNLAFERLAENEWVPDLEMLKMALMAPAMADGAPGDQGAPMMDPAAQGGGGAQGGGQPDPSQAAAQGGAMPGPQAGAQVQQDPMSRFKPSPMAPIQEPPSQDGNMMGLAQEARHPAAGSQAGAGGMGADGGNSMMSSAGPQDPAPEMPPDQKLLAVQQNIPGEALNRWAGKFSELEQQVGMSIDDPQQIAKFIAQMQKDDAKMVDQAIKNMSVQTAPVRPTIQQQQMQRQQDPAGGGGAPPGGDPAQPPPDAGAAPPADPAAAPPQGGGGQPPAPAQKPKPKPQHHQPQQGQQAQQPQQKVAAQRVKAWLP